MKLPIFNAEWLNLPDIDLGKIVLSQFIAANAESIGLDILNIPEAYAARIVELVQQLPDEYDYGGAENAALFLAMRLAAHGKFELAGIRFRDFWTNGVRVMGAIDEACTGRRRQSRIAREPRIDALQGLIAEILKASPGLGCKQLLKELEKHRCGPVIKNIDNSHICFCNDDGKYKKAPISGLKDRLSRAKQRNISH